MLARDRFNIVDGNGVVVFRRVSISCGREVERESSMIIVRK